MKNNFLNEDKQKYLLIIFVGLVLIIFIILRQKPVPSEQSVSQVFIPKTISIDFSVLEDTDINNLKPFETISPFSGKVGRTNPFLPY